MQIAALQRFFASSPAMHLLRSPNAPWILDFLNQQFKHSGDITRVHSVLVCELELYLEKFNCSASPAAEAGSQAPEDCGPSQCRGNAETYLATWCAATVGWLKRFVDSAHAEPVYQLTPDVEMVLTFVNQATKDQSFVGTNSRLRSILHLLDNVASGVAVDAKVRIDLLQRRRAEIDRELTSLQAGNVQTMSPTDVREQFSLAAGELEQLKSEFRSVEERFKAIIRSVQKKVLDTSESRSNVLEFALNSEDLLKQGDQGKSFLEFLKLVHSPESQDRISRLVQQLVEVDAVAAQQAELESVRSMVPTLLAEAEKIVRTTQHLSSALRRLLDSRSTRHHQQLAQLLRDIRTRAALLAENPPGGVGLEIEVELEIQSPLDRPFWSQPEEFVPVDLQIAVTDPAGRKLALAQLTSLDRIDWQTIRRNIAAITLSAGETSLAQLLERFPTTNGTIEVLGYLQVAFDDGHQIDREKTVRIRTDCQSPFVRFLQLPSVVFLPDAQRRKRCNHGQPSVLEAN